MGKWFAGLDFTANKKAAIEIAKQKGWFVWHYYERRDRYLSYYTGPKLTLKMEKEIELNKVLCMLVWQPEGADDHAEEKQAEIESME